MHKPPEYSPPDQSTLADANSINPDLPEHIVERFKAGYAFVEKLNQAYPVIGYHVFGSSGAPKRLRAGHALSVPSTEMAEKRELPSDVDVMVLVDTAEVTKAREKAIEVAKTIAEEYKLRIDPWVYDRSQLQEIVGDKITQAIKAEYPEYARAIDHLASLL